MLIQSSWIVPGSRMSKIIELLSRYPAKCMKLLKTKPIFSFTLIISGKTKALDVLQFGQMQKKKNAHLYLQYFRMLDQYHKCPFLLLKKEPSAVIAALDYSTVFYTCQLCFSNNNQKNFFSCLNFDLQHLLIKLLKGDNANTWH